MPVYSSLGTSYGALQIGDRIRRARKRLGWTLSDLARRFDVSPATLSAIENDKSHLTVDRLIELSAILSVRPDALFSASTTRHFHVTRRTDESARHTLSLVDVAGRTSRTYGHELRPLAAPFVGKRIEPFEITIQPESASPFISHHADEFFCVLDGVVDCALQTPEGAARERLARGDSMYFRSHMPHCLRAAGRAAARTVHVLCAPPGESDADRIDGDAGQVLRGEGAGGLRGQLAAKFRLLRRRHGLSVGRAASALGVSARALASIERARRPVGISLLLRACTVYRKPVEYFLASALIGPPFYTVQRARAVRRLRPRRRRGGPAGRMRGYVYKSLADRFGPRSMYPYYIRIPHDAAAAAALHEHHGQEFVYVLQGEVTLVTIVNQERTSETLARGDACLIDATVPHRFIAAPSGPFGRTAAEVIDVFWCPLGEDYLFHGDEARRPAARPTHTPSRLGRSS
ncbi:MAG TPA: cupin domain-containing protein [Vicinamibacterales bacterium]|jgi:transcriptional regulator with XRE-family HTH domain/uncharacterized cupin superfamily protein|nr:cupin domain-containing protein [Vicinamibacterales bacterium]